MAESPLTHPETSLQPSFRLGRCKMNKSQRAGVCGRSRHKRDEMFSNVDEPELGDWNTPIAFAGLTHQNFRRNQMSFLDRIAAAVTPAASDEDRAEARRKAEAMSAGNDWLGLVLQHHRQIEAAFDRALGATGASARREALEALGAVLTGHSNAEEAVLYPAVVEHSGKAHATMAYEEQAMAKINMAMLEQLDPMSEDWREKLEHTQGAVAQHVYQEESEWFPDVAQNAPADVQTLLTKRYTEEFDRYCGDAGAERTSAATPPIG